jgi:hypothetical protein
MIWWPWHRKHRKWEIQPVDIHLNPLSPDIIFVVRDGWEPFGVSPVPNTLDPNQLRIWTRKREGDKRYKAYEIKIANAGWGGHEVLLHLSAGWEPFGVSMSYENHQIWFRRKV